MWTIKYRGFYVHGYCAKPECHCDGRKFKSYRAAQLHIARKLKAPEQSAA